MLGGITGLNDSTMAHAMLTSGIGCYSFSDRVLLTSTLDKSHQGLKDDASNFVSAFDDLQANLKRMNSIRNIKSSLSKLKPNLNSIDLEMPGRERIVLMMENEGIRHLFLVSQESEGFRRLLACLLALYQTPSKQTLLFDEPEKGIYPAALPLLAEEFMACAASGRGQVILTTHSPQFLDHFKPEQIRVVEMNGYGTQIGPVSSEQMEALHEHFLRPGELLTVDQARMEQPAAAD